MINKVFIWFPLLVLWYKRGGISRINLPKFYWAFKKFCLVIWKWDYFHTLSIYHYIHTYVYKYYYILLYNTHMICVMYERRYLPLIHVPLKGLYLSLSDSMRSKEGLLPLLLVLSLAGDSKAMLNTIRPNTAAITTNAIRIPRQLRWLGVDATNSWNKTRWKLRFIQKKTWYSCWACQKKKNLNLNQGKRFHSKTMKHRKNFKIN